MVNKLYSVISWLKDEAGHNYEYNLSVQRACELIGWRFFALVPKKCQFKALPSNWTRTLSNLFLSDHPSFFKRIYLSFFNLLPISKLLINLRKENNSIVLYEHFGFLELLTFFLSYSLFGHSLSLWLVFRDDLNSKRSKDQLLIILVKALFKKKKIDLHLFSDSEIIANQISSLFKKKVTVLPIPHTHDYHEKINSNKNEKIFWWPGPTRFDKGLPVIEKILEKIEYNKIQNIKLTLAKTKATEKFIKYKNVLFLDRSLTREQYKKMFIDTDLILLPYIPSIYYARTSGIFVESICAEKLLFVTQNTWMAYELKKFDLEDLIFNENKLDFLDKLDYVFNSKEIKEKIKAMKMKYIEFHSLKSFAKCLQIHALNDQEI